MSCEGMESIADKAMRDWVEVEKDLIVQRAPIIGRVNCVTSEQVRAIEDAISLNSAVARRAIDTMKAWLAARELHR